MSKKEQQNQVNSASHVLRGLVVAAKAKQTVTVLVGRSRMHPLYHKAIKQSKKYLVHDEVGVKEGDLVEIVQTRPMSRAKRFKILRVVGVDMATIVSEKLKNEVAEAIAEVMPVEITDPEKTVELEEKTETVEKPKPSRIKKEAK